MKITDIRIGNRIRRDLGDIQTLAKSIEEIGLLQPIVVNQNNKLIAGQRRIEACRYLGWYEIPEHVVDIDEMIKTMAELHENAVRKDFTVSERIAILEEIEKKRLGHRQKKNSNLESFQKENMNRRSVDIVSKFTGASQGQLAKEKKIVDAARRDPEKFGILLRKVDAKKMKVNKAFTRIVKEEKRQEFIRAASSSSFSKSKNSNKRCKVIKADFAQIAATTIKNNSVHLILTDPFYAKEHLLNYEELAKLAFRTLIPGGSLVTVMRQYSVPTIIGWMESAGLTDHWHIIVPLEGPEFPKAYDKGVTIKHKLFWWFVKGKWDEKLHDYVEDVIKSTTPSDRKEMYDMAQSYQ